MKQIAGRYKVIEKLGTGLSGTVFSVKDGPKGPTVALKLSNPTEDSAHHLEKEFFTLSQLDHPNIVRVFDFGRTKNRRAYFTMELVNGKPFTKCRFKDKSKLYDAIAQILIALEYIHSKGLIHCDLKPENILIKKGAPKLLDFGLATVPEESAEVKGTMHYIAPELFRGARPDPRADLYSLGVVLYQTVTGALPFKGDSVSELLLSHSRSKPPPTDKPNVDPEFSRIIMKLLEVDPAYRYDTAETVLDELSELMPVAPKKSRRGITAPIFTSPFVGRNKELTRLEEILEKCRKGETQVVFIIGPEGVGKSRLATELKIRAQMKGFLTVKIQFDRDQTPELDLSSEAPNLVLVEDAHLAGPSQTGYLSSLVYAGLDQPTAFVLTCEPRKGFECLKKHLAVAPSTHIALKSLSKTETRDMVQGMLLGMHNPGEITGAVYGLSGGLPLLVEETVRSMVGADRLQRKRKRWHLKSEALKQVKPSEKSEWLLSGQLENVRPLEMEILRTASLVRGRFTREMLRDVVGISDDDAPSALMSLVSSGLVAEETGGRFAISNGYLASFIRDQMPNKGQKALHLKIGAVLRRARPAEAARHYILGGDKEKAFKIGLKQARASEESGKNRDACELYEIALEAAPEPEGKFGILKELVRLHNTLSDFNEALQAAQKAIRIGQNIEKPVDELQVKAAVIHRKLGEQEKSRAILNQVISKTKNDRARCYALCELAWLHMEKNEYEKASEICEEARKIALANKDKHGLARVYHNMGTIRWSEKKLKAALEVTMRAVETRLELGEHAGAADSLNNLGVVYWNKGDMDEAEQAYKRALEEYEKAGDRQGIAIIRRNLGLVAWTRGQWELAVENYENAYSIEEKIGAQDAMADLDNMIGVAEEHLGNWKKALAHFKRNLRFSQVRNANKDIADSLNGIGTLLFKLGDLTEACETFEKCIPLRRAIGDLEGEALCLMNLAMVKKELEHLDAAMDNIDECITIFEREGMEKDLATAYRVKAEILLSQNEVRAASKCARTAAKLARRAEDRLELSQTYRVLGMVPGTSAKTREQHFQKSIEITEEMNARYHLGQALLSYGQFLLDTEGRLAESLQQLKYATEIFEHLGAKRDLEGARKACANAISRIVDMRGFGAGVLQVSALNEIASLIGSMTDISAVYQKVVDSVVNLLGAERGLLLLFSESGKRLEVAAENSMDKATTKDARTLSRGVIREAVGKGVAVICDDAVADPRFNRNRSVILNNIHSLLCVPLKLREEIIGTIYVDSRVDKRLFSKEDIPFVNTLANMMAMAIDNARYYQEIRDENVHLRTEVRDKYSLGNIIGKSAVMQDVFNMISRVAGTDTTVLIEGETGTGKELVARAIHYGSRRADKRFLTIDCSALPDTLLESELFGHKRGSFTGAAYDKRGLFEAADGGTVFLDEIGDASSSVQSRLLRVLEQSEVRRVGESSYRKVDVRILCATNKNLRREIGRGRFREDLYFRLNVLNIKLPPLRKRREDIPLLANHFLRQAEKELGKRMTGITPAAVRLLMAHGWPGNVRELQHEIERACALVSPSRPISAHSLSPAVRGKEERREELDTLVGITQDLEKRIIEEALENLDWNRSWVAKELGLSRQGLLKKMRRHGLTGKETTQEV